MELKSRTCMDKPAMWAADCSEARNTELLLLLLPATARRRRSMYTNLSERDSSGSDRASSRAESQSAKDRQVR